jgi:hypothetical protein
MWIRGRKVVRRLPTKHFIRKILNRVNCRIGNFPFVDFRQIIGDRRHMPLVCVANVLPSSLKIHLTMFRCRYSSISERSTHSFPASYFLAHISDPCDEYSVKTRPANSQQPTNIHTFGRKGAFVAWAVLPVYSWSHFPLFLSALWLCGWHKQHCASTWGVRCNPAWHL